MKKITVCILALTFSISGYLSIHASDNNNLNMNNFQSKFNGSISTTASPGLCSQTKSFAQGYARGNTTSYISGSKSKGISETWFELYTKSGDVQALVGANANVGRYSAKADSGYIFGSKDKISGKHYASGY